MKKCGGFLSPRSYHVSHEIVAVLRVRQEKIQPELSRIDHPKHLQSCCILLQIAECFIGHFQKNAAAAVLHHLDKLICVLDCSDIDLIHNLLSFPNLIWVSISSALFFCVTLLYDYIIIKKDNVRIKSALYMIIFSK